MYRAFFAGRFLVAKLACIESAPGVCNQSFAVITQFFVAFFVAAIYANHLFHC